MPGKLNFAYDWRTQLTGFLQNRHRWINSRGNNNQVFILNAFARMKAKLKMQ